MKKFLLLSALALTVSMSYAQTGKVKDLKAEKKITAVANVQRTASTAAPVVFDKNNLFGNSVPKTSFADGVYYTKPEGTLWRGMTKEGYGYYAALACMSPAVPTVFKNQCSRPTAAVWSVNGTELEGDANNDFSYGQLSYGSYYAPTISVRENSWSLDMLCDNYPDYGAVVMIDTLADHTFNAPNCDGIGFGAFDTGYLYGSGIITFGDGTSYPGYGVAQNFPAPASPLYVEDIYAMVYTDGGSPIKGDAKLMCYVTDEEGNMHELSATASDVSEKLFEGSVRYTQTGVAEGYIITFSEKTTDIFGTEVAVPFVINSKFTVQIEGFMDENINVGFLANDEMGEDTPVGESAKPLIYDAETGKLYSFGYNTDPGENLVLQLYFTSCFDYIDVATELSNAAGDSWENTNILIASEDGTKVYNKGLGEEADFALIAHTFDWYDGVTGAETYEVVGEYPDWITLSFETTDEASTYVTAEVAPLPAGETSRKAEIYFGGKGYISDNPLVIVQGDATGIENISAIPTTYTSNVAYNLMGQKVAGSAKGIIIKNGKKVLVK